jgi:hypothetical protein
MEMTQDEKEAAQAAIEELTKAIIGISRTLMLDSKYKNAIWNYLTKAEEQIKEAQKWLNRIGQT